MTRKKPIIGISGGMLVDEGGIFPGYKRAYVNNDYVRSTIKSGGVPMIIPITNDDDVIREQAESIDALILSGGHDLNPLLWGEEPLQKLERILPERDSFDIALLNHVLAMKKPVLGICRGMQLINVAHGGTLYQDLSYIEGCSIKHTQGHTPSMPTHTVQIQSGTRLNSILGDSCITNSFHHQAVNKVGNDFIVSASSKDGIVEAIEKVGDEIVLGIQWHPEMMTEISAEMQRIFDFIVEQANES